MSGGAKRAHLARQFSGIIELAKNCKFLLLVTLNIMQFYTNFHEFWGSIFGVMNC